MEIKESFSYVLRIPASVGGDAAQAPHSTMSGWANSYLSNAAHGALGNSRHRSPHSRAKSRRDRETRNRRKSLTKLVRRAGIEPAQSLRTEGF